jgi:hypothetical protein
LKNLAGNKQYQSRYEQLTQALEDWMVRTGDPMLEVFRGRADPQVREAYMAKVEADAAARKGGRTKVADGEEPAPKKPKKRKAAGKRKPL